MRVAMDIRSTALPEVKILTPRRFGDARGWFKENWQRAKMLEFGLPDFGPVQNNMSFNANAGSEDVALRKSTAHSRRRPRRSTCRPST